MWQCPGFVCFRCILHFCCKPVVHATDDKDAADFREPESIGDVEGSQDDELFNQGVAAEDEKVPEEVEEILPRGVRRAGRCREISLVYFPTLMKVSPG